MRHDGSRYWIFVNKRTGNTYQEIDPITGYSEMLKLSDSDYTQGEAQDVMVDNYELDPNEWEVQGYQDW